MCSSFTEDQLKTLQEFWCDFTITALRKSSVSLDLKFVILKMCFCLLTLAKRGFLDAAKLQATLTSFCDAVKTGISNVILSVPYECKIDGVLGLGIDFATELKVS